MQMVLTRKNFLEKKDATFEISFDDGGEKDLKVADILEKYDLSATFYIVVDYINKQGYLTWEQVKELEKRGHVIGSHSISHPQDLKKLYEEELFYEIQSSKDMIETVLDRNVTKFCYPRGRQNERVRQMVAEAGYVEARVTGKPGVTEVEDKLQMPGTVHIYQRKEYGDKSILEFAKETIDRVVKEGGYCNIFGHSREIERDKNWEVLEQVLQYIHKIDTR